MHGERYRRRGYAARQRRSSAELAQEKEVAARKGARRQAQWQAGWKVQCVRVREAPLPSPRVLSSARCACRGAARGASSMEANGKVACSG